MKTFRFKVNNKGFTLTEVVLAAGLVGVLLLTSATFLQFASSKAKQAQTAAFDTITNALLGANLPKTFELASSSQDFINLPINKTCSDSTDHCLRYLDLATGTLYNAPAPSQFGSLTESTVQFYRDHRGDLVTSLPVVKSDPTLPTATYTYTVPANVGNLPSNHSIYATYPLVDTTSQPLPMLARLNTFKFSVPVYTAQSAPTTNWIYTKTNGGTISATDIANIKGQPVVIYNPLSPQYFAVKVIADIQSCANSACTNLVPALYQTNIVANDVKIQLADFDSSFPNLLPNEAMLPYMGSWPNTTSTYKIFPNSPPITEGSLTYFTGASFDPRNLLHYFHSAGIRGDMTLVPVALASYRLSAAATPGRYNLVRDLYLHGSASTAKRTSVMDDVAGPVIFARKLGSTEMKVLVFDPAKRSLASSNNYISGLAQTFSGAMKSDVPASAMMERRKVTYPKNCEMTFTTQSTCGDQDVVNYYNSPQHQNEENANGQNTFKVVLGYWLQPSSSTSAVPTVNNWYAIGYDDLKLDNSQVGLKMIDSNERLSANKLLQDEVERVTSLMRYAPRNSSYKFYSTVMLCLNYDDATGTLDTTNYPTYDNYSAGAAKCFQQRDLTQDAYVPAASTSTAACGPAPAVTCAGGTTVPVYSATGCSWVTTCPPPPCPPGTSTSGAGGTAVPSTCKCTTAGDIWNTGTSSCYTPASPPSCTITYSATTGTGDPTSQTGCFCSGTHLTFSGSACITGSGTGTTSGGCFVAGTKVTLADGSKKNIEDMKSGEQIRAFDELGKNFYVSKVVRPIVHPKKKQILHHFLFDNGVSLTSNEEHPFYIVELEGWFRAYEIYAMYEKGEKLTFLSENGIPTKLLQLSREEKNVIVYNLQVEGLEDTVGSMYGRGHSFMANGIVSHNVLPTNTSICMDVRGQ